MLEDNLQALLVLKNYLIERQKDNKWLSENISNEEVKSLQKFLGTLTSIIGKDDDPIKQSKDLSNFIRYVNQHFGNFAKGLGIDNVSTYWARHSFATSAIQNGASMEFVGEMFGHSSPNTTKVYFADF